MIYYLYLLLLPILLILLPLILRYLANKTQTFNKPFFQRINNSVFYDFLEKNKIFGIKIAYIIPMLLGMMILGAARYQADIPNITEKHIAWYNEVGGNSKIIGVIDTPPDQRDSYISLRLKTESIQTEGDPKPNSVEGYILARVPFDSELKYGDKVFITGEMTVPEESEEFSYKDYLARQGVYSFIPYANAYLLSEGNGSLIWSAIYNFKEKSLDLVYDYFPDPEASLMAGILLGVETGISKDLKKAFQDTGTSHIIAISGFNMTIIAGLFSVVFSRSLGKRRGAIAAALGIGVYTILVGADPAVVRAAIMGGLSLFARQVGRRQDGLNSLAFTAAVMCVFNPTLLWDVGFQLSFMATLGLILYADPFKNWFDKFLDGRVTLETHERLSGPISEYLLFTIAAQLTILPILVYHFQQISLNTIPANLAILPAQAFIMIFGGLAILLGIIIHPIGQLVSYIAWPFMAYTIRIVEWFSNFKGGVLILGQVGLVTVFLYYLIMIVLTIWGTDIKNKISNIKPKTILFILGLVTVMVWQGALNAPDGKLHVTMMDVGTGDAILIETPDGRFVLINGGSSARQLSNQMGRWLPLFHRKLDFLVIASTQEKQIKALPDSVERFSPNQVLWAGAANASRSGRYLKEILTELRIPIIIAEEGQVIDLGYGIEMELLLVGSRGAILLLEWDDFRMLMPLGMSFEELELLDMGGEIGSVSVLVLADHGYGPLNPKEWIDTLHPELILLSVSAGDYDGLPSKETLGLIVGYPLLRTDLNGWIYLTTDGKELWVEAEK